MRNALQEIAQEISQSLATEMGGAVATEDQVRGNILDLLIQQLSTEVVRQVQVTSWKSGITDKALEARLQTVEKGLEKLTATREVEENEDDAASVASDFPNLKYAKPKYKNVESMLKYIESENDKGGVKLVIMNFND